MTVEYSTAHVGSKYAKSFRVYIKRDGKVISPFHDIPLFVDGESFCVNAINEIPRFEKAKFEISKSDPFNPILQDTKNDAVRYVKNVYPFVGYPFNYGALPKTWENPAVEDKHCKAFGDNDPVDVLDIGSRIKSVGEIYKMKVLGALALLDGDEADWKIIGIDAFDKDASVINNIEDVNKMYPSLLKDIRWWFRNYKVPDGKPTNTFAFDGEYKGPEFAMEVIKGAHNEWMNLMSNGYKNISLQNATDSAHRDYVAEYVVKGYPEPEGSIPASLSEYSFVEEPLN